MDVLIAVFQILAWGLVATVVMTTIMFGSQYMGLSRLSLPFLLGTWFTANRDAANILGFLLYTLGGWLFAFAYYFLFVSVGFATWWLGAIAGALHAMFLLLVILPLLPYAHPRMASEYAGATSTRRLEPPGFLGLHYGYRTPLTTLIAQTVYGIILGAFFKVSS